MKWYFALSASTLRSQHHDWVSLIRTALRSAQDNTNLRPHLLWDGPDHEFLNELRERGVTVIFHRVPFYDDFARHKPDDPHWCAIAAGCFLRVDIPHLEREDDFVLYTDADVMFQRDPAPMLRQCRPAYFSGCTEFTFEDGLNSGVMLLNIPKMRETYQEFSAFIRANLPNSLDQTMYRRFYAGKWEALPPEFNWKPYWGINEKAVIIHWHGIKPVVSKRLLDDPNATTHPDLARLVRLNPEGYRHYLQIYEGWQQQEPSAAPVAPKPHKTVAVVLVVKDEASDILAWLAWYRLLGFDAAIVYDDDSTDGTWELLEETAKYWDIRLSRTVGERGEHYQNRQSESYRHALSTYAHEFSWLAFFDADEFLQLSQDTSVTAFLARFPEADEVAVNWCNYGSSGHVLKPEMPPPLAYTWHGHAQRPVNRHVKCFVRPEKVGPKWLTVHCFDVAPTRAVLANGEPVAWSETLGIIAGTPDWSVAKIMHYQCRSMEHFIERLKKRPQFQNVPNLWSAYDVRDEEDTSPQKLAGALLAVIEALRGAQLGAETAPENRLIFDIGMAEGDDTALYLAKGFRVVGLEPDAKTYYQLCERFAAEIKAGALTVLNYAAGRETGQIVEFFHNDKHPRLSGFSAARPEFASGFTSYHVVTIGWADLVAQYGLPHYAKIDIEGGETAFLAGAQGAALPAYISVECHDLGPAEALYKLGYRRFQLSDQNPPGGYAWPDPPREGEKAQGVEVNHTSGPFGRELPPDWLDFEAFCAAWRAAKAQGRPTWYDCHAALG